MSDNNSFLSNYGKNMEPAEEVVVRDAGAGYKYEEKSGFKKPELSGGYVPPRAGFRRFLIPAIAAAAVVLGIVLTLILLLGGGVKVPDMSGWTMGDANLWASQNNVMLKTVQQYNDTVDEGKVISQDIAAGGELKKGAFLTLTVSQGHDLSVTLPVPDFTSMTMEAVQAWADQNFMTKVRITSEFSDTIPSGKVIRYEITDNTVVDKLRRDTAVYVIVSKGLEDASSILVTVPDFKTLSISEAYIFASDNGLVLTVTEQYDDYVPKNTIISASVKAQEKINKGSEINLVVSKGKMIEIPDFSDYTKEQASTVAAGLGITVSVIEKYSGSGAGTFLSQSISAGSTYEDGDILELTYSLGRITVPSFIGQTLDAIKTWENEVDSKGGRITIARSSTNSDKPKGIIIYQSPANTTVSAGTTIYVTVSLGKIIYVPDFVDGTIPAPGSSRGYDTAITRDEAIKMCEDVGLVPVFESAPNSNRLPGEVWDQSLPAGEDAYKGTKITEGTKIKLTYKPNDTDEVPDFVNPEAPKPRYTKELAKQEYNATFTLIFVVNDETDPTHGSGEVVGQSITARTTVSMGTILTLYLNP